MPDTLTWEEAGQAEVPESASWESVAVAKPEISIKLSPYEQAEYEYAQRGLGRPPTGMEAGTELTTALGEAAGRVPQAITGVTEAAGKGVQYLANIPTRLANIARHAAPGAAGYTPLLEELPRPQLPTLAPSEVPPTTGMQALAGIGNLASRTYQGLLPVYAPPEVGLTLPLLGGRNILSRIAAGTYGAGALASVPEAISEARRTLADPNAPLMEKIPAVGEVPVRTAFGLSMLRQATARKRAADAIKERQQQADIIEQHRQAQAGGLPAEAGRGNRLQRGAEIGGQAQVPQEGQPGILLSPEQGRAASGPALEGEVIEQSAYRDAQGRVFYGANHPEALVSAGGQELAGQFPTRESRNTPAFGYKTNKRPFVVRDVGGQVAKQSGQQLEPFDADAAGRQAPHSDQIAAQPGGTAPLGDKINLTPEQHGTLEPGNARNQLTKELGRSPTVEEINEYREELAQHYGYKSLADYQAAKTGLTSQDATIMEAEREALPDPSKVVYGADNLPEGEPFAPSEVATINRRTGKVVINPQEFSGWMQDMRKAGRTPEQIRRAVQAVIGEEGIHLATTADMAVRWMRNASRLERMLEHRLYTGKWTRAGARAKLGRQFSDTDIGFEAIRRHIQRLSRMSSTEASEAGSWAGWKVRRLEELNGLLFNIRKGLGTRASREQLAILDKVQDNIGKGIVALGGTAPEPSKVRKDTEPPEQGMVRLYTGKGGVAGAGTGGSWFSTNPQRAASFGPDVSFVDVPKDVAAKAQATARRMGSGTSADHVLPNEWVNKAEPVSQAVEAPVYELEPSALRRTAGDLLKMSDDEFAGWVKERQREGVFGFPFVKELAKSVTPEDKPKMIAERDRIRQEMSEQLKGATPATIADIYASIGDKQLKAQTLNELLQFSEERPSALRRGKEPGQAELFLPPLPKGAEVEREGFAAATPAMVGEAATTHFQDVSQPPSLERFQGELQSQFGAGVKKEAIYYAWQDALWNKLTKAKGAEIDQMIDQLGLRGKLQEEHQQSFAKGSIPDPIDIEQPRQAQFAEMMKAMPHKKVSTPQAVRRFFGPQLRKRYAAIAAIAEKLNKEAGPKPEKPWSRTEVGPEDVNQIMGERQWYTLSPEEAINPEAIAKLVSTGASVHAEGKAAPPRSVTRGALAVRDKSTQKIRVVSAYRDPRRGVVVTDPNNPAAPARKLDASFLKDQEPMVVMQLREPVQRFRMEFKDQTEFDKYFGDIGIEGTEGIETSSFAGPLAGAVEAQAGITQGPGARPPAQVGLRRFPSKPAPLGISRAPAPTELEMPERAGPIPRGTLGPVRYPQTFPPTPPTTIRLGAPTPTPEGLVPTGEPSTFTLPRTGAPVVEGVAAKPAGGPPMLSGRYTLAGGKGMVDIKEPRPAALRRTPLADEVEAAARDVGKMVQAWPVADRAKRMADNAGNRANNLSVQAETRVRLASEGPATGVRAVIGKAVGRAARGKPDVLAAANAMVEAKAVLPTGVIDNAMFSQLATFRQMVDNGMVKARQMAQSPNWHERRIGRAWVRNQEKLGRELDYASAHWNDLELQETARRISQTYRDQVDLERSKGYDVTKKEGYDPHRYDAALWNGESFLFQLTNYQKKILGRKFREKQLFKSYYAASEAGPYLAVTRDSASLVGHRVRQGMNMVLQNEWKDSLKNVRMPDGRPLAIEPVSGAHRRWLSPQADYEVVPGANHLAVHEDYASLIRRLTDPSQVELWGPSRAALHLSQVLKHSLLVGDFFHLGRMIYYGTSIMGRRAGFRSGWSVLDIAERDMPEAVSKGIIRQKDVDWANTRVRFGSGTITRRQLAEKFYSQMGANLGRVQDALYKDLLTETSPTAGKIRIATARIIDPSIGAYNRFLFDRMTRGLMTESAVRSFEKLYAKNPNASPHTLMRDIARDINNYYGNIGRQGWFTSKTWQDISRMLFLAPQWVEGLVKKEAVGYARISRLSQLAGTRRGVDPLGVTGRAIGSGMIAMLALTQAINLITRRQPTWMNGEKGHKWDAWIPGWGSDSEGFWLSPMAIFNEISHDLYRLSISKPTFGDAVAQIIGNKEQPVTRATLVALTGTTPMGRKTTTTAGRLAETGKALLPVPISFGKIAQAAGHAIAPGLVSPPPPGAVQRQAAATLGIKIEPKETAVQEIAQLAKQWVKDEGLEKSTGWQQIQTDEPGYSKMRAALRGDDLKEAKRNLEALRKTRTDAQILQSMANWLRQGYTGSAANDGQFWQSLNDRQLEVYDKAQEQKQMLYEKFLDWFWEQD